MCTNSSYYSLISVVSCSCVFHLEVCRRLHELLWIASLHMLTIEAPPLEEMSGTEAGGGERCREGREEELHET